MPPHGSYSEERIYPEDKLLKVPDFLSNLRDQDLAAVMLKGLTAQYLLRRTYFVKPGDAILVHAGGSLTNHEEKKILYGKKNYKNPPIIAKRSKNLEK